MSEDIRAEAAKYYDVNPTIPDDIAFYQARLPGSDATVLELGCGTGRVLLPLAARCGFIQGLDRSQAMLARCQQKLQAAAIPPTTARVEHDDITHFALGGSVPISGTCPFWTHKSLCFETYPAVKIGLYPLQGHYPKPHRKLFPAALLYTQLYDPYDASSRKDLRHGRCEIPSLLEALVDQCPGSQTTIGVRVGECILLHRAPMSGKTGCRAVSVPVVSWTTVCILR
jgi:SAM-dependent methyltransferase